MKDIALTKALLALKLTTLTLQSARATINEAETAMIGLLGVIDVSATGLAHAVTTQNWEIVEEIRKGLEQVSQDTEGVFPDAKEH